MVMLNYQGVDSLKLRETHGSHGSICFLGPELVIESPVSAETKTNKRCKPGTVLTYNNYQNMKYIAKFKNIFKLIETNMVNVFPMNNRP